MNCYVHAHETAVGICALCQRAVCHGCIERDTPRIVCRTCAAARATVGFEYRSATQIGSWPLLHVSLGLDPATMRPRVARGVVAIGNVAIGAIAIAGVSLGLVTVGGLSVGLVASLGGAALGLGVSCGGLAVGSVAFGGLALGLQYAIGGAAFAPAVIDGTRCHHAARDLVTHWVGTGFLPPNCR